MSNPTPVGLGPDEDERIARFAYDRFFHQEGMPSWDGLGSRDRKNRRRNIREVVDALQGCGYTLRLERPGASDGALIGRVREFT